MTIPGPGQYPPPPGYGAPHSPYSGQSPHAHPGQGYPGQGYPGQAQYAHNPYAPPQHGAPPGGPIFRAVFTEHTGMLILWSVRRVTVTGTVAQCEAEYRRAQAHCLVAGWWSVVSVLLMNWVALLSNRNAISRVRKQAAQLQQGSAPYA
ncbi:hypothetical protein [Williamsia sp. CHRR-6]|uniref:hypothetical protein n=1 Tax=Williamsia sp. CHRR-6 TaxID=2835871 RepID=UPI001BDB1684|nr:hypothetical protein [Williamsia sp. CHRR-6]MBT0568455.1 hypothetical protein [Williamsia sp. CHRR-6]